MLRFTSATVLCVVWFGGVSMSHAQTGRPTAPAENAGRATIEVQNGQLAQQVEPLPPTLEKLLVDWARASAGIKRLEGEHLRRVYDMTFEVEKLSEGKFFFEFPDRGRIDVTPAEVTAAMKQQRLQNPERVQKKKNGQPFDLEGDREEKWICDGKRIYSIDEAKLQAEVMQLPPDLQGTNIMDSPLPFLFGMPPEKAKRRFGLTFSREFVPTSGFAHITAVPRLPQDAQGWSRAEVILDLKTWLPVAVKLTDPAETKITVFSFRNMKINNAGGWIQMIPGVPKERLFEPDLRNYQVNMMDNSGTRVADASGAPASPVMDQNRLNPPIRPTSAVPGAMPALNGQPWQQAVKVLEGLGYSRGAAQKKILLYKGSAAANAADVNKVQKQNPAPGSPLARDGNVELWIWTGAPAAQ